MELVKQELCESGVHPSQFISINFEDMRYSHLQTAKALHDEITARAAEMEGKVYLFFDEMQEVKDWEECVNSLRVSLDCDIYITGSNARLLSGGMPYLANLRFADEPSKQYLHDLFNSVQLKDIVKRNKVRDVDLLEHIITYVMANVGTTFSATSLAKFFKSELRTVAPETILNYIRYCRDAYLWCGIKKVDSLFSRIS